MANSLDLEEYFVGLRPEAQSNPYQYSVNHVLNLSPASTGVNDLFCTIATNNGILLMNGIHEQVHEWHKHTLAEGPPMDVLTQCSHASNPSSVVIAGTRSGGVHLIDLRLEPRNEDVGSLSFRHASAVTHLRNLTGHNEHHVLVAGLRSTMATYDLRFVKQGLDNTHINGGNHRIKNGKSTGVDQRGRGFGGRQRSRKGKSTFKYNASAGGTKSSGSVYPTAPILTFPSYRNEAHTQIGLDVQPDANIVAAAHDNGTVGIYSLFSGRRLRSPTVDAVGKGRVADQIASSGASGGGNGGENERSSVPRRSYGSRSKDFDDALAYNNTPIKSLMFYKMPWEKHQSLWLGVGASLKKLSV